MTPTKCKPHLPLVKNDLLADIYNLQDLWAKREHLCDTYRRPQDLKIVWLRSGNGTLQIDLKEYEMLPNTLYCILPHQLYQLEFDMSAKGYFISFPDPLVTSDDDDLDLIYRLAIIKLLHKTSGLKIMPQVEQELEEIIQKIAAELRSTCILNQELIIKYIGIFLIVLARQFNGSLQFHLQSTNVRIARDFILLVDQRYLRWKRVKDYADEMSISPTYLTTIILKISGSPASYHIRKRLVLEAKRQAAFSNMNMKEIANHLGFKDCAHFSKFFKIASGKNFRDFKNNIHSNFVQPTSDLA